MSVQVSRIVIWQVDKPPDDLVLFGEVGRATRRSCPVAVVIFGSLGSCDRGGDPSSMSTPSGVMEGSRVREDVSGEIVP